MSNPQWLQLNQMAPLRIWDGWDPLPRVTQPATSAFDFRAPHETNPPPIESTQDPFPFANLQQKKLKSPSELTEDRAMAASSLRLGSVLSSIKLPSSSPISPNSSIGSLHLPPIKLVPSSILSRVSLSRFSAKASSASPTATELTVDFPPFFLLNFRFCKILLIFRVLALQIKSVPTKPVEGQKTGTSGLRKKARG